VFAVKNLALVVDDDAVSRRIVVARLQRGGFLVAEAEDGAEALARVDGAVPDVIVTDISMPRMDGWELIAQLRRDPRTSHIPIVVVTSGLGLERAPEGVRRVLLKPDDLGKLASEVHAAIAEAQNPG
jgi:chemosensory pili system protein ChpA (sensor histidine kinase/response regulator)